MLTTGLCAPAIAAVQGVDVPSCSIYSDGDKKDDKKTEEEEEPDCE